jgi:hypothetical protein
MSTPIVILDVRVEKGEFSWRIRPALTFCV